MHITYWITPHLKMKATHIQHHQNTKTTKHNTQLYTSGVQVEQNGHPKDLTTNKKKKKKKIINIPVHNSLNHHHFLFSHSG